MIEGEQQQNPLVQFLLLVLVAELVIFVGVAVYCILSNTLTLTNYANGLFIAGALVMGIGALGVMGNNRYAGDLTSRYIETVSDEDMKSRQRRIQKDGEGARITAGKLAIIGLVPLITSIVLMFSTINFA